MTVTKHHRRPPTNVIHVKRDGGSHRATYVPETGVVMLGAHGCGHDEFVVGLGWTRATTKAFLNGYDFRCCNEGGPA